LLKVSGFRVDRLESVVKLFDDPSEFKASNFTVASKNFIQRSEALMNGHPYATGEAWREILCRTLIADRMDWTSKYFSDSVQQYEAAKRIFANMPHFRPIESMNTWAKAWFRLMPDYAFCKTATGYVGLVPHATSDTDEVFMFQGSDLPFVLRPLPTRPGYYRFVGGCYIHGLMKGEAWKLEQGRSVIFLF